MSFGDYPADHSPFTDMETTEERVEDLLETTGKIADEALAV